MTGTTSAARPPPRWSGRPGSRAPAAPPRHRDGARRHGRRRRVRAAARRDRRGVLRPARLRRRARGRRDADRLRARARHRPRVRRASWGRPACSDAAYRVLAQTTYPSWGFHSGCACRRTPTLSWSLDALTARGRLVAALADAGWHLTGPPRHRRLPWVDDRRSRCCRRPGPSRAGSRSGREIDRSSGGSASPSRPQPAAPGPSGSGVSGPSSRGSTSASARRTGPPGRPRALACAGRRGRRRRARRQAHPRRPASCS